MIKPTVGRRVWYWPSASDKYEGLSFYQDQPCDAGIAYVYTDRCVNLTISDHFGKVFYRKNVVLIQEGDEPVKIGTAYCEWMPYQLGQAKSGA